MKPIRRWLAGLLCAALLAGLLPMGALAVGVQSPFPEDGILTSGTYTLTGDVTLTRNLTVNSGVTATIDLAGHTLRGNDSGSVITVYSGGSLTLQDNSDSGKVTGGAIPEDANQSSWMLGAAVTVNGGTFTMNGGTITDNDASHCGGVVNVSSGRFTMEGGSISNNTGTGLSVGGSGSSATIGSGAAISGNTVTTDGASCGGVHVLDGGSVTLNGGTISNNTVPENGGGVFINSGTFTMNSGSITGNTAGTDGNGWGGGVYIMTGDGYTKEGAFIMKGGSITGNHAASYGGGVVLSDTGSFRVSGAPTITENTHGSDRSAANVWLSTGKTITNDGLTGGSIGVTLAPGQEDEPSVTILAGSGFTPEASWFSSDDEGYVPEVSGNIVVLRAEGQGGQGVAEVTEEGYITRAGLAVKVHGHAPFGLSGQTSGSAASVFTDVGDCSDTQLNAIGVLYDRQILGGATPSTFAPEGTVSRAAAAVVIWRAAGSLSNTETVTVPYSDVNTTQWYSAAIHCLYAIGVLDGSDADSSGNFRIDDNATVQDIEKWLGRYQQALADNTVEEETVPGGTSRVDYVLTVYQSLSSSNREEDDREDSENPNGTPFVDISGCTPAQQEAITYFYSLEIIYGTTTTTFEPYAAASNAQVATFLYRVSSTLGGAALPQTAAAARSGGDDWYQDGVNFLVDEGVLTEEQAEDDAFNPHAPSLTEKVSAWSDGIKPNAPVISPAGGRYSSSQTVTITADAGLTIHYTTDGSVPTRDSAVYTGPITVGSDMVIQAMAVGDGLASDVVTARYTFGSGSSNSDSGSSSSSSSSTTTTTERNPDGSTTTTVTNRRTGTVTKTTKYPDGSTLVVETKKDGTVTTTETDAEGNRTETVENPDGSSLVTVDNADGSTLMVETKKDGTVTTTETDAEGNRTETVENPDGSGSTTLDNADGSASVTTVDAYGRVTAEVSLPIDVVHAAGGEAVALPMPAVTAPANWAEAPTVTMDLPRDTRILVEIPVEDVTPGTVAVLMEADGTEKVIKNSATTENGVAVALCDGDTVKIVDNSKSFADVPAGHWAADAVAFAASRELFSGTSDTTFGPEIPMNRGMLVTVLYRLEDMPAISGGNPFTDVEDGMYYTGAVLWADNSGIVAGDGSGSFAPDRDITREELAVILHRYAQHKGYGTSERADLNAYTDAGSISPYAVQAMAWANAAGLITGDGSGALNPGGSASRSEVAAILQRFMEMVAS